MTDTLHGFGPVATARLAIAALAPTDAEELRAITDHPSIAGTISFLREPFTLADSLALIGRNAAGRDCFMGMRTRDDGRMVGMVGANLAEPARIEIGYWVGIADQGRGYASEAAAAVRDAARDRFPDRQVIAHCRRDNAASWRVLTKLGFVATDEPGFRAGRVLLILPGSA